MRDAIPVSVIIPNYNNSEYLTECLMSVVSQTVLPSEIIVVDDASSDGSIELLKALGKDISPLKIIELPKNAGVSAARNRGIEAAVSPYVTFLDSDDFYMGRDKLEREYALMVQDPEAVIYSPIVIVDADGKRLWGQLDKGRGRFLKGKIGTALIAGFKSGRPPRDYMVSRESLLACGAFDEALSLYEDYDLLIRLGLHHEFKCTFNEGTAYRQVAGGLSDRSQDDLMNARRAICQRHKSDLSLLMRAKVQALSAAQETYELVKRAMGSAGSE